MPYKNIVIHNISVSFKKNMVLDKDMDIVHTLALGMGQVCLHQLLNQRQHLLQTLGYAPHDTPKVFHAPKRHTLGHDPNLRVPMVYNV